MVGAYWAATGDRRADKGHVVSCDRVIDGHEYRGFAFLYADAHPGDLDGAEFEAFCLDPDNCFFRVHARRIERDGETVIDIRAWSKVKWQLVFPGLENFVLRRVGDGARVEKPFVLAPGDYHLEVLLK